MNNIINFPSGRVSKAKGEQLVLTRAQELKRRLIDFCTSQSFRVQFNREFRHYFGKNKNITAEQRNHFTEWFAFEWIADNGQGVIDRFIHETPELTAKERAMLIDWKEPIDGVFKVKRIV
ncbi:MAG: hypothetical protein AB1489_07555, partial [Acidobacteriota bacterium]